MPVNKLPLSFGATGGFIHNGVIMELFVNANCCRINKSTKSWIGARKKAHINALSRNRSSEKMSCDESAILHIWPILCKITQYISNKVQGTIALSSNISTTLSKLILNKKMAVFFEVIEAAPKSMRQKLRTWVWF